MSVCQCYIWCYGLAVRVRVGMATATHPPDTAEWWSERREEGGREGDVTLIRHASASHLYIIYYAPSVVFQKEKVTFVWFLNDALFFLGKVSVQCPLKVMNPLNTYISVHQQRLSLLSLLLFIYFSTFRCRSVLDLYSTPPLSTFSYSNPSSPLHPFNSWQQID